jgi:hypothetical protein
MKTLTFMVCLSHLVFRKFPDSLNSIAHSIEMFLRQNLVNNGIKILPFTTAVVVTYIGEMMIHPHCDHRYSPEGEFLDSMNSQERDTATVILVIGDRRCLEFELYHQILKQQKVEPKVGGHFDLEHGSLFILHPSDEKPSVCESLEEYGHTFFKHNCNGVKRMEDGMSIGIAFCSTKHLAEVQSDTGCVVLDDNLDMNMIGTKINKKRKSNKDKEEEMKANLERDHMIECYWLGQVHPKNIKSKENNKRKDIDEVNIQRLWKKCSDTHFCE